MDWSGCDLVEVDPEKVAGQPVVKGTRVPADVVLNGGEGEIRTHGTREGSTVFETAAFDHSATSPLVGLVLSLPA